MQGYVLSRPRPAAELTAWLAQWDEQRSVMNLPGARRPDDVRHVDGAAR